MTQEKDLFCKIIAGEIPARHEYRDDDYIVIHDINPQAPIHLLVIPIKHYGCLEDFTQEDSGLLGRGLLVADKIARKIGLDNGYRLIINEGKHGGKIVEHLHIHMLGGKELGPMTSKKN